MQKITIGFSRRKTFNPLSALIMALEHSDYSHTYVKLPFNGRIIVFQASGLLVNFQSEELFNANENISSEFDFSVTDEQYQDILNFALDSLGLSYGIGELIGMGIKILFGLAKNPFPGGKSEFICVKLAAEVAIRAGLSSREDIEDMDLNDLHSLLLDSRYDRK